ncbi:MAG: hypothetical protein K6D38_09730 [Pseudobutyrivibrio sp.]|nr:hypothetical protein [Pseudobutyrivibrio sp.]
MANNLYDYTRSDEPTELNNNSISNPQQYQVLERKQRIYRNDVIQAETNNGSMRPNLDLDPNNMTHSEVRVKKEKEREEAKRDNIPYNAVNPSKLKKIPIKQELSIGSRPVFYNEQKNNTKQAAKRRVSGKDEIAKRLRYKERLLKQRLKERARISQLNENLRIKNKENVVKNLKYINMIKMANFIIRRNIKQQQSVQQNTSSRTFKH